MQHARKRSVMKTLFSSCEPDLVVRLCRITASWRYASGNDHVKKDFKKPVAPSTRGADCSLICVLRRDP
jgi:hypothetical protein